MGGTRMVARPMVAVLSILALGSCNKGTEPGTFEPLLTAMVITVDGTEYQATKTNGGFGGQTAQITSGSGNFSAKWLKLDNSIESNITSADFELRAAGNNSGGPLPTGITWEQTGAFTGTLTGLTEGQSVPVYFSLYHKSQTHTDFGPYFLTVKRTTTGGGGEPPPF